MVANKPVYQRPSYEVVESSDGQMTEFYAPAIGAIAIVTVVIIVAEPPPAY